MRALAVTLALVALVAVATAPAAAQSPVGDITEDCEGVIGSVQCGAQYVWGSVTGWIEDRRADGEPDSQDIAAELKSDFNSNSADWVDWANDHTSIESPEDYAVIEVEIRGQTDETIYLITESNNSEFTSAEVVDDTSQSIDWVVRLEGRAARDAPEVLSNLYDKYVTEGKQVNGSYAAGVAGKYGDYITITNA